jgi:hypothetical protein
MKSSVVLDVSLICLQNIQYGASLLFGTLRVVSLLLYVLRSNGFGRLVLEKTWIIGLH